MTNEILRANIEQIRQQMNEEVRQNAPVSNGLYVSKADSIYLIDRLIAKVKGQLKSYCSNYVVNVWNKDTVNAAFIDRPLYDVFCEYAAEIRSHITRKNHLSNLQNKINNICDYATISLIDQAKEEEAATDENIIDNNEEIIDKIDRINADLYNMSIATIKMYRDLMRSISEEAEDIIDTGELSKREIESFHKLREAAADLIYKIDQLIHFENDEQAEVVLKIARIKYPKEYEYIDEVHGAAMERFRKLYDLL